MISSGYHADAEAFVNSFTQPRDEEKVIADVVEKTRRAKLQEVMDKDVLAIKKTADDLVRAGKHEQALGEYEACLAKLDQYEERDEGSKMIAACHGNRALCYLKLKQYANAENEATKALNVQHGGTAANQEKCLYRRSLARQALGVRLNGAVEDCHEALRITPENPVVLKLWMELKTMSAGAKGTTTADVDALVDAPTASDATLVPLAAIRVKCMDADDGLAYARATLSHPLGWPALWRGVVGDCGAGSDGVLGPVGNSTAAVPSPDRAARIAKVTSHPRSFVAAANAVTCVAHRVPPEEFRAHINALVAAPIRADRGLAARAIAAHFCRAGGEELRDAAEKALAAGGDQEGKSSAEFRVLGAYANPGEGKLKHTNAEARAGDAILSGLQAYATIVRAITDDAKDGSYPIQGGLLTDVDVERWCMVGLHWGLDRLRLDARCPAGGASPARVRFAALRLVSFTASCCARARRELLADPRMLRRIACCASGINLAAEEGQTRGGGALVPTSEVLQSASNSTDEPTLEHFESPLAALSMALVSDSTDSDAQPLAALAHAARDVLLQCIARHAGIFNSSGDVDPASTLEGPLALLAALLLVEGSGSEGKGTISALCEGSGTPDQQGASSEGEVVITASDVVETRDSLLALAYLGLPADLSSESVRSAPMAYAPIRVKCLELMASMAGSEVGRDSLSQRPACLHVLALAAADVNQPAARGSAASALARFSASSSSGDSNSSKEGRAISKENAGSLMSVATESAIALLRATGTSHQGADRAVECLALATATGQRGCVAARNALAIDSAAIRGLLQCLSPPAAKSNSIITRGAAVPPSPSYAFGAPAARAEGAGSAAATTYLAVELIASVAQSLEEARRSALAEKGIDAAEFTKVMELQAQVTLKAGGTGESEMPEMDAADNVRARRQALVDAGAARGLADVLRSYRRYVMQSELERKAGGNVAPSVTTARLAARALKDLAFETGTRGRLASDGVLKACALIGSMGGAVADSQREAHEACRHDALWCAARVLITTDPRLLDAPMLLGLCGPILLNAESSEQDLCCFESLLALTNLAGLPEPHEHANRIADLPTPHLSATNVPGGGGVHIIYKLLFKDHTLIRRAVLELLCNLSQTEAFYEYNMPYEFFHNNRRPSSTIRPNEDALKLFVSLLEDVQDDPKSAQALTAMLSSLCIYPCVAKRLCSHKLQGVASFVALISGRDPFLARRALACIEYLAMSVPQVSAPVFQKLSVGTIIKQLENGSSPCFEGADADEFSASQEAMEYERGELRDSAKQVLEILSKAADESAKPEGGGCL